MLIVHQRTGGKAAVEENERLPLTDRAAKEAQPPKYRIIWDHDGPKPVTGFGLRITRAGAKAWIYNYRSHAGIIRQLTIGDPASWFCRAARDRARELAMQVDLGGDPMAERHEQRSAPATRDLWEYYEAKHLPTKRPSSQRNDKAMWQLHIGPALGIRKLSAITRDDIGELHRKLSQEHPFAANRVVMLLSKMFNLAIQKKWMTENPCFKFAKNAEEGRQRFLNEEEIARLFCTLDKHPGQSADAIRLALLTGARIGELLNATWSQIDLGKGVWAKPSSHTKQKRKHVIPLNAEALAVLRRMREQAEQRIATAKALGRVIEIDPALFPGRGHQGPQTTLKKYWAMVRKQANLDGLRVHDLRHSYASVLASSGLSLPVIGALLGHSQPSTTAKYSHLLDSALREATETAGKVIGRAKVVKLAKS